MKPITLAQIINKELKDEEFKFFYEKELIINNIARLVSNMREHAGLTQKELAARAHTTQPVVARIESGKDSRMPSLELLARIAAASNTVLNINFTTMK